ncbi:MAG: glycosyltransferase [Chitinophagaceae bacterium]|nr:glycosyltransferase [Chitinophagaceae bacterium]
MTIFVSVIIPCHNYGDIIKKSIRSVLHQTHPYLEIIVVNDGSTDIATLQALEDLKRENITILHQENKGPSAARNAGAAIAKGDYLFFLDHDDTIHPNTIELLLKAFQHYPEFDFIYSSLYFHGQIPEYFVWRPQTYNAYDLVWSSHPTLSCLITRTAHEKVNGFSENLVYGWEDWEYWIKLSKHSFRGKMINLPLYNYWQHGRTHTAVANENTRFTIDKFITNNPDVYNPVYIQDTKKKWRPIVTIIAYHDYQSPNDLSSLWEQSIPDKQIIIVSTDPTCLTDTPALNRDEITIINSRDQPLTACFNQAFRSAKGEFVFLFQNAVFAKPTSLEEAIWQKIFDKNAAWHYYLPYQKPVQPSAAGLTEQVHQVSGILLESSLLRFAGGFADGPSFHYSFQDLLLRLEGAHLAGTCIHKEILLSTITQATPSVPAFEKYPQLFGRSPRLDLLQLAPLIPDQLLEQPVFHSYKQSIDADLGAPWYNTAANQRMNTPSLINPTSGIKNVLYCIPFMEQGGAEKVDIDILAALKRDGYWIVIVTDTVSDHPWKPKFEAYVDEIFHVETITNNKVQRVKFLEYLLISRNASLLFIRSSHTGYQLAASLPKEIKAAIPTVDLMHAYDPNQEDWVDISAPYDPHIDEHIVITKDMQEYMVSNYGISRKKTRVILNGLDTSVYAGHANRGKLRAKTGLKKETRIIGYLGRLAYGKGLLKWLEVAATLNKTTPSLHFVLAGDGPLKTQLQEKARALKIHNISFIGWQEKVQEVLEDFDIMLMTSDIEGLPVVIMEALCLGIPVVAPDIGGIREILINDFSTLVAGDASPKLYAEKILQLLNMEEGKKEGLRKEAIQFVKQTFDIKICQQNYLDALSRLIASKQTSNKTKAIFTYLITSPFLADNYRAHTTVYEYQNLSEYYLFNQNWQPRQQQALSKPVQFRHTNHISWITPREDAAIADWYFNQYEVLPLWFKRLGHIVKILYGKRSWRTIYDDSAKGYDTRIGVQEWYNYEYEVLPLWFKRAGHVIKIIQGKRPLFSRAASIN